MNILICVDTGDSADIVLQESLSFLKNIGDIQIHIFTVVDMAMISVGRDDLDENRFMDMLEHQTAKLQASIAVLMGDTKYAFSSEVGYPSDEILKKADTIRFLTFSSLAPMNILHWDIY